MMKRVSTKIGDVFSVKLDDNSKRYFQYIASDHTQLNSDVIRGFKSKYPIDLNPDLLNIIRGEVSFYAHCITKFGVKMNLWDRVGNISDVGALSDILFRCAGDYGRKVGEEPVTISKQWYVWRINDKDFTHLGELKGEYKSANIGLVINPNGIIELLKGNKYPSNYPD